MNVITVEAKNQYGMFVPYTYEVNDEFYLKIMDYLGKEGKLVSTECDVCKKLHIDEENAEVCCRYWCDGCGGQFHHEDIRMVEGRDAITDKEHDRYICKDCDTVKE